MIPFRDSSRVATSPALAGACLLLALSACRAPSGALPPGAVEDVRVAAEAWESLQHDWASGRTVATHERRAGLRGLERIAEWGSSRVTGRRVDFAAPIVVLEERFVSVFDAETGRSDPVVRPLPAWTRGCSSFGLKYVLDHVGPDTLARTSRADRERVRALCQLVHDHALGSGGVLETRERLRRLEEPLYAGLGLTTEGAVANTRRIDTSIWARSAYTTPGGWLRGPRLHLSEEVLRAGGATPLFVYVHEMFHALAFAAGSGPSADPGHSSGGALLDPGASTRAALDELELHELSAQAFAFAVVEELRRAGVVTGIEALSLDALPGDEPERAARGVDPWSRLAALYRGADTRFPSRDSVASRYGYSDPEGRLARVHAVLRRVGVDELLDRLAEVGGPDALARLEERIAGDGPDRAGE